MAKYEPWREDTLEGRLLLWLADWLTTLLLSVGMVFPCLSAYGISGGYGFDYGAVLAFCVFGSLCASAMFTWRHGYWAALGTLAAGGLVFWRLWVLMERDWHLVRDPGLPDFFSASSGALFLLYALVVLTLGWVVVRVRTWWLAAALTVLPVIPAIQAGVLPAWGAMLLGFAGWGTMLLTDLFSRKDQGGLARAKLLSLGGMAVLLMGLFACLPREGYVRPQWATEGRARLIQSVNRQLERFFAPEDLEALEQTVLAQLGLDLSLEEGGGVGLQPGTGPSAFEIAVSGTRQRQDLLNIGPRRDTGRQIMTVRTDQPNPAGRMYLRGVSFDTYTGTSWENSESAAGSGGAERFTALTAPDVPDYVMQIRNTSFAGVWYYPYRFTGGGAMNAAGQITGLDGDRADDPNLIPIEEMENFGREDYRVTYRPGGPEDGFAPLDGADAGELNDAYYAEMIVDNAQVPRALWEPLEALVEEIRREPVSVDARLPEQFQEKVAAAARTAQYLSSIAVYDPDTPAMEGADFVTYFLEEGRGYCVHFATAGTLLLRMQGIAARYVSGYVAQLDRSGVGVVLDGDSHAWVEIYLGGYGWYPVEMTPGYSGGESGVGLEGAAGTPEAEEFAPEDPEEDVPPEEEAPDEETPEEEDPEDGEDPSEDGEPSDGEPEEERRIAVPWKVLFGIAVFWAVLCAAYLLALLARRRAMAYKDTNRSVLNAYGRYKRLRRWGCGEDNELERLAKKAKFSQHTLTAEERESAWKCLDEDVHQSRVGQPVRRRWLLALLCPIF